jgi:hypothetical protein
MISRDRFLLRYASPLLLVAALAAGCGEKRSGTVRASPGEDLPILWEDSGTWSRLSRPVQLVVRDEATLAQVPLSDVPVDFERQMVLVRGLGPTSGSGIGVRIVRVWRVGSRIRVQERRIHPGLDAPRSETKSSPWTVVVVPRSDLPVEGYSVRVSAWVMSD